MFSLESLGVLLTYCARHAEAEPVLERALAHRGDAGRTRYQTVSLAALAETALSRGRVEEAERRNEAAFALARETGMRFSGPLVLG